jgi:DNA-binding NtrC family response regulator
MSELTIIQSAGDASEGSDTFVAGVSCSMRALESVIATVSATDDPILLVGESGVGKQVFARRIHDASRRNCPLLQISCGAISADVMANPLFARGNKGVPIGTVIFDEIGELDRDCQRKLLHIIPDEQGPIGQERLSARIVSTSSQNIEEEVRTGRFRNDLYHRLNGVGLRIPPLRERREDILVLFDFFLSKHAVRLAKPHAALSTSGTERLLEYSWPGNVRELENLAIKTIAVGNEDLALSDLARPSSARQNPQVAAERSLKAAARAASRSAERELILSALSRTQWNRKRAARELQISYKSLLYKLKQIGLPNSGSD